MRPVCRARAFASAAESSGWPACRPRAVGNALKSRARTTRWAAARKNCSSKAFGDTPESRARLGDG
eukprot:4331033-Alexandrium_andersonii.AAC.1